MITSLVLDCDGVLTDGKQYIGSDGRKMFKAFHTRDIKAVRYLVHRGIAVYVISADSWPGADAWCDRVGAVFVYARDKLVAIRDLGFDPSETAMIGDDAWDVQALKYVEHRYCPRDAEMVVKAIPGMQVLPIKGGKGVVSALCTALGV